MKYWWFVLCLFTVTAHAKEKSWPRIYNEGVTAYRSNDFSSAVTLFEQATASPKRELQERAFYNLGNTHYRMGEVVEPQGPEQAVPVFKKSLKSFEDALALNPQDQDAKFNRDLVKKKIEELQKKQQEQQQQQQDQQKQDQQKDKQDQEQNKDQQQQKQEQQNDQQKKQQQQQDKEKEKQRQQDQQNPQEQQQQEAGQPNNLQKTQTQILLDNLREDERNWNFFPEVQMKDLKDKGQPVKDW